jgi:hypothetical protein
VGVALRLRAVRRSSRITIRAPPPSGPRHTGLRHVARAPAAARTRFVDNDAKPGSFESRDHAALDVEHGWICEVGQQIVATSVVVDAEGLFLDNEVGRGECDLHARGKGKRP